MSPLLITIGLWIANILFGLLLLLIVCLMASAVAGFIAEMMNLRVEIKRKGNKDV